MSRSEDYPGDDMGGAGDFDSGKCLISLAIKLLVVMEKGQ